MKLKNQKNIKIELKNKFNFKTNLVRLLSSHKSARWNWTGWTQWKNGVPGRLEAAVGVGQNGAGTRAQSGRCPRTVGTRPEPCR